MPKVETQDFASHEEVSAIYIDGKMLIDIESVACETQDFASLLFVNIIMSLRLSPYIAMAAAL
jgi:hypothetical protein